MIMFPAMIWSKDCKDYSELGTLPSAVNKNIFIEQIKYNYSGQLPAEAQIRILWEPGMPERHYITAGYLTMERF